MAFHEVKYFFNAAKNIAKPNDPPDNTAAASLSRAPVSAGGGSVYKIDNTNLRFRAVLLPALRAGRIIFKPAPPAIQRGAGLLSFQALP